MQSVTTPGNIANSNVIPLPEEIHPPNTIPPNPIYNSFSVKWTGENATAYDIQYKVELSGEWKDWLVNTTKTEAVFPPEGLNLTNGKTYYFRSRAKDVNGLWEDYPQENEGDTHTKIVFSKATTFIIPLPKIQTKRTFQVSWNGINAVAYNVQYKKDKEGTWKNWVLNTSSKSKNFTGEDGHTYYFRCAGRDSNGIWAGYLPDNLVNTYTTISLENQTSENTSQTSSSQTGSFSEVEEKVDIVLLSLNFSTSMISENPIEITLKVKNSSSIEIPNCILKITAEDGFEEEREVFLKPNSIETFKFLWKTEKTGKCKIIAEIKTPEKIQEKNLRNNLLQKFIYLKNTKSNLKEEKFEKKIY
jgi:YHS domain-containing protein